MKIANVLPLYKSTRFSLAISLDYVNRTPRIWHLTNDLENGDYVIGIFLDFSKAFDKVNHEILLDKRITIPGIRDNGLQWFQSYLTDRQQFVTHDGVLSRKKTIKCGVPQGSILGPLLFLVYSNDLYHVYNNSFPILFADSTNHFFRGNDPKAIESEINTELDGISLWLKVNKISLNTKKTHFMILLRIEQQITEDVSETTFLGVIMDNGLKWKKHTHYTSKKISNGIGMIIKARHCLDENALITL